MNSRSGSTPVPQREELLEARVGRSEVRGRPGVQLAPVRPSVVRPQDPLHPGEVRRVVGACVDVEREVDRVTGVRGGQPHVVGRGVPDLHREADPPALLVDQGTDLGEGLHADLARHGVLHLPEHHPARRREDPVGDVGVGAGRQGPGGHPVDPGDAARHDVADPVEGAEERVRQQLVVDVGTEPGERLEVVEGAVVALGQHPVGVREPVGLRVRVGRRRARRSRRRPVPTASAPRPPRGRRPARPGRSPR